MHVTVAGKQVETGEALKIHVRDGLDVITRKYFDHALEANVTFHRSRAHFACENTVGPADFNHGLLNGSGVRPVIVIASGFAQPSEKCSR